MYIYYLRSFGYRITRTNWEDLYNRVCSVRPLEISESVWMVPSTVNPTENYDGNNTT